MADLRAARRYASALFGVAVRQNELETAESDLKSVVNLWESTPALSAAMVRPQVPKETKSRIWSQLLEGNVSPLMIRFVAMLVDRRRIDLLPAVGEEFQRLADEHRNIVRAQVTSAFPLSPDLAESLRAKLSERTGKTVELIQDVDASMVGGLIVRVGDRIMDASVRGYLGRLQRQMAGAH